MGQINPDDFRLDDYDFVVAIRKPLLPSDLSELRNVMPPLMDYYRWTEADPWYRTTTLLSLTSAALYGSGYDVTIVPERVRSELAAIMSGVPDPAQSDRVI